MKKNDESGDLLFNSDKSAILQEARIFNETPIKPMKCCLTLSKVLYLIYQGEPIHANEATDLFFAVTKLFQSKDTQLRRMVYLVIKELSLIANDVIMATSSLVKDMNDKVAAEIGYRANAIRALCSITDNTLIQGIERFVKQAIVDKDPSVSSAALVSAVHLFHLGNKDIVRRWVNEVQEALNRTGGQVQYHALGLMYLIKQHDKMAVIKIIQTLSRGNSLRSPYAYCMLIRYTFKVMDDDGGMDGPNRGMFEVLENCLRHRHEMVNLEAARAICNLKGITPKDLFPAVSVLQLFLNSPKSSLRFASIRTLNRLALKHPSAVAPCNLDMENLITDSNRSIATFAITTLLKTGNEASVDRLMKQISGFMSEISDEFKVIVADAIRSLCLKFPNKQAMMLQFLATALRDEGGYEFKRTVVEGIFDIIAVIPESKDSALSHLCEFIEDCEYTRLAVRVLHLLGEEGPRMSVPAKFIRYIYNRTILENAPVRAAAVAALAKFAIALGGEIKKNVTVLIQRCQDDPDDEVRDRAIMYLRLLEKEDAKQLAEKYIADDSTFEFEAFEKQLIAYLADGQAAQRPFETKSIPVISMAQATAELKKGRKSIIESTFAAARSTPSPNPGAVLSNNGASPVAANSVSPSTKNTWLEKKPEFASFGPLFRSSVNVELTEADVAEYVVVAVKHVFADHIVFEFNCKNTLEDVVLERVSVVMETDDSELSESLESVVSLSIEKLAFDSPASAFVAFRKTKGRDSFPVGSFATTLKFISKDCDPQTGEVDEEGFDDTYQMETVELELGDYTVPQYSSNFTTLFEELGAEHEVQETFQVDSFKNIKDAIVAVINILPMAACEGSDQLPKDKSLATITAHTLLLSGVFLGGYRCAVRVRMAIVGAAVAMELTVRSENAEISRLVSESIG